MAKLKCRCGHKFAETLADLQQQGITRLKCPACGLGSTIPAATKPNLNDSTTDENQSQAESVEPSGNDFFANFDSPSENRDVNSDGHREVDVVRVASAESNAVPETIRSKAVRFDTWKPRLPMILSALALMVSVASLFRSLPRHLEVDSILVGTRTGQRVEIKPGDVLVAEKRPGAYAAITATNGEAVIEARLNDRQASLRVDGREEHQPPKVAEKIVADVITCKVLRIVDDENKARIGLSANDNLAVIHVYDKNSDTRWSVKVDNDTVLENFYRPNEKPAVRTAVTKDGTGVVVYGIDGKPTDIIGGAR